jgi:hypothetical protein
VAASGHTIEEVAELPKIVTLAESGVAGEWDVQALEDGRLLLSPHTGPSVEELARRAGGRRLSSEEFRERFGHLPRDGEG